MGKFIYKGPMSAATLGDGTDVILMNGKEVTLPDDNEWVKSLVAQGRLTPAGERQARPARPAPKAKTTPQPADKETK
ncbi:MAG: hypothetical protein M0R28_22945 [Pigmentiphaga sp.]|nr:hypothetical protein [Pigmentiphaga sp.]